MATDYELIEENETVLIHIYGRKKRGQKELELRCSAIIDVEDFDRVSSHGEWHSFLDRKRSTSYWQVRGRDGIYLSRFILKLNPKDQLVVRYLDKNTLNCRRNNLEAVPSRR